MKCHLLLVVIIAGALAAPIDESKSAVILRYDSSIVGVDGYYFEWVSISWRYVKSASHLYPSNLHWQFQDQWWNISQPRRPIEIRWLRRWDRCHICAWIIFISTWWDHLHRRLRRWRKWLSNRRAHTHLQKIARNWMNMEINELKINQVTVEFYFVPTYSSWCCLSNNCGFRS